MISTDADMSDFKSDSALSDTLDTETLAVRSMMPDDYCQSFVWIEGRQFLKVEHAANIRSGTPVSKIWQHGMEYRLTSDLAQETEGICY